MIQARPIKKENPGLDREGRRKRHPIEQRERYRLLKVVSIGNNFIWAKRTIGTSGARLPAEGGTSAGLGFGLDRTEIEGAVTAYSLLTAHRLPRIRTQSYDNSRAILAGFRIHDRPVQEIEPVGDGSYVSVE